MRPNARFPVAAMAAMIAILISACATAPEPVPTAAAGPRNVIFLLGDGMGAAHVKAYRVYADDPATPDIDPLPFDDLQVGAVATDSIAFRCRDNNPEDCVRDPYAVTDSAASASAYATGHDTLNGAISVDLDGNPRPTVLELAAGRGKGTGVVSTSQVTHASPAAFATHAASRRDYAHIADQYHDNQVGGRPVAQVILGGGTRDFRRLERDVAADLVGRAGYTLVEDRDALLAADEDRLLGLFAPVGMPRQWDRADSVPTLADMTGKAIEVLSRNEDGFFLMVEGSQIDWAAHGRDIAGVVSEMEGFTAAIEVALEFARADGDTLVVFTADHETGGLSLGNDGNYAWTPEFLRALRATPAKMVAEFLEGESSLSDVVSAHVDAALTEAERAALDAAPREAEPAYSAINAVLDERTHTGWTTGGHTGVDVPLYATGPGSAAFGGVMRNEELGQALIDAVVGSN